MHMFQGGGENVLKILISLSLWEKLEPFTKGKIWSYRWTKYVHGNRQGDGLRVRVKSQQKNSLVCKFAFDIYISTRLLLFETY